jgi:hypothetical protein
VTCQCKALDQLKCQNAITQEDLLCDSCRGATACMMLFGQDGEVRTPLSGHYDWSTVKAGTRIVL